MSATELAIGTFYKGGQWVEARSLEVVDTVLKLRDDGLVFTPGSRNPVLAAGAGRYDGANEVGGRHDNGTISCNWAITGSNFDTALSTLESVLEESAKGGRGRWLRIKPPGASRSSYVELRGAADFAPVLDPLQAEQNDVILLGAAFPTSPLVYGPPMDILDDFSTDWLSTDWTIDSGSGLSVAGGVLDPSSTGLKQLRYTGRGYTYGDVEVTVKITTSSTSVTGSNYGVILKWVNASNFLYVEIDQTSGNMRIRKCVAGVHSAVAAGGTVARALATNTSYWLRGRIEGNIVYAEAFTSAPTPMGSPTTSTSITLDASEITLFGLAVEGGVGLRLTPAHAADTYDDFTVRPYTYRNQTTPLTIALRGVAPGKAPGRVGIECTPSGGSAAPNWAQFGWTRRPTTPISGVAPFGLLDASGAGDLSGWSNQTGAPWNGGYGGGMLADTSVTGPESYAASFTVDPSTMEDFDPFFRYELYVEVWARFYVDSSLVAPTVVLSHRSAQGNNFGAESFTQEYQTAGKTLGLPSADAFRFHRLGTLVFSIDPDNPATRKIWLAATVAAGSTGNWGLDYLWCVPSRSRCLSPSGKANDSSFPKFVASTSETKKLIRPDLRGLVSSPNNAPDPDHGLGGSKPEFYGSVDVAAKLSSMVPGDPTSNSTAEQLSHSATLHFAHQPAWRAFRP